jgi:hypothetical protein
MAKLEKEFLDRSISSQDAIYSKLVCDKCTKNGAIPMFDILEYEEGGHTFFECTCLKCGTSCTIKVDASSKEVSEEE